MKCACAILSSVARPSLQYFSTISNKRCDFIKNVIGHEMFVWFSLQSLPETFLILRSNDEKMYIGLHEKCPLFLSDFTETWIFLTDLKKNWNIKFYENLSTRSRVFLCGQTDRQTWTKLIAVFRSFANSLKNETQNTNFVDTAWAWPLRTRLLKALRLKTSYP